VHINDHVVLFYAWKFEQDGNKIVLRVLVEVHPVTAEKQDEKRASLVSACLVSVRVHLPWLKSAERSVIDVCITRVAVMVGMVGRKTGSGFSLVKELVKVAVGFIVARRR